MPELAVVGILEAPPPAVTSSRAGGVLAATAVLKVQLRGEGLARHGW